MTSAGRKSYDQFVIDKDVETMFEVRVKVLNLIYEKKAGKIDSEENGEEHPLEHHVISDHSPIGLTLMLH